MKFKLVVHVHVASKHELDDYSACTIHCVLIRCNGADLCNSLSDFGDVMCINKWTSRLEEYCHSNDPHCGHNVKEHCMLLLEILTNNGTITIHWQHFS